MTITRAAVKMRSRASTIEQCDKLANTGFDAASQAQKINHLALSNKGFCAGALDQVCNIFMVSLKARMRPSKSGVITLKKPIVNLNVLHALELHLEYPVVAFARREGPETCTANAAANRRKDRARTLRKLLASIRHIRI